MFRYLLAFFIALLIASPAEADSSIHELTAEAKKRADECYQANEAYHGQIRSTERMQKDLEKTVFDYWSARYGSSPSRSERKAALKEMTRLMWALQTAHNEEHRALTRLAEANSDARAFRERNTAILFPVRPEFDRNRDVDLDACFDKDWKAPVHHH